MRFGKGAVEIILAALVAGCGVTSVESGGGESTIEIRGQYTAVSNATQALERDLTSEANRRCPGGWTKISDTANPFTMAGGRIWRIRCNSAIAAGASVATAPVPPPASAPTAAPRPAGNSGPNSAVGTTAVSAATQISREDLIRLLTSAVMRASPYLTQEAAQAIVERQLSELAATNVRIVGPNGQLVPLTAPGR